MGEVRSCSRGLYLKITAPTGFYLKFCCCYCLGYFKDGDKICLGNEHLTATIDELGRIVEFHATGSSKCVKKAVTSSTFDIVL